MNFIKKIFVVFFQKDVPFFLPILLGITIYFYGNIISTHKDSPLLVYHFKEVSSKEQKDGSIEKNLECELVNFSNHVALRDITIDLSYSTKLKSPREIYDHYIISVSPSPILNSDTLKNVGKRLINYEIPILHPRAKYILKFRTRVSPEINENPKLYLHTKENIRLSEYGTESWILENQDAINIIFLMFFSIVVVIYIIFYPFIKINQDKKS